jgi:hypothetical protein
MAWAAASAAQHPVTPALQILMVMGVMVVTALEEVVVAEAVATITIPDLAALTSLLMAHLVAAMTLPHPTRQVPRPPRTTQAKPAETLGERRAELRVTHPLRATALHL